MLLCRTGRLSAAALDHAFMSTRSFLVQVRADRLRDSTLTLRKGYTCQRYRCFCVSVGGVDATLARLGKQQQPDQPPAEDRDSPCASDWGHLDRVATKHGNLSTRVQSQGGYIDMITQPLVHANRRHSGGGGLVGNGLFTGDWVARLCSAGTMQTRTLSTKKSDAGEEQTANDKGGEQNLKEASSTSSSTAKAPGEPEPEGGKPNKTQQLKKVFKEYGAVGVSFHIGISLMSLGMFYLLISR